MVYFLLLQLTYKNSILHYKVVKVMIDILNFAEVISNMVVCHHNFLDLAIAIETFSNIVICHYNLLGLIVINNGALYPFELVIIMDLNPDRKQPLKLSINFATFTPTNYQLYNVGWSFWFLRIAFISFTMYNKAIPLHNSLTFSMYNRILLITLLISFPRQKM